MTELHRPTLTQRFSPLMGAVQAKQRTAQIGTTLRTLSNHLALLPPTTRIAAKAQTFPRQRMEDNTLNLLLIPFPYRFGENACSGSVQEREPPAWGWFNLDQTWLTDANQESLNSFVSCLIKEAESKSGITVNGLVLPELSLDWLFYRSLVEHISSNFSNIEFIISGSSMNCMSQHHGNYALVSNLYRTDNGREIQTISQGKHHRWRLNRSQLTEYNLSGGGGLDSSTMWWEKIGINHRELYASAFRDRSSFSVLICEDLARSDPCHETLRSLGPNIVFCLLMDSVQIPTRWPAYYSLGLTDDPGCSVLTFTSRALIERSNDTRSSRAEGAAPEDRAKGAGVAPALNWSVGLWRDGAGGDRSQTTRELHCPPGDHAVLLQLVSCDAKERSMDGRKKDRSQVWMFDKASTVRLPESAPKAISRNPSFRG